MSDRWLEKRAEEMADAERALVGSLIRLNSGIHAASLVVAKEDFDSEPCRLAYEAILDLAVARGQPVDVVTLAAELRSRGHLEHCGGAAFVAGLDACGSTGHQASRYARIVRDNALLRAMARAGEEIRLKGLRPTGKAEQLLEESEQLLWDLRSRRAGKRTFSFDETLDRLQDAIDAKAAARSEGKPVGIVPRIPGLEKLVPAIFGGQLVVVAGRPGSGKTAFGLSLIRGAAKAGEPCLFCSLEMGDVELAERVVADVSGVPAARIATADFAKGEIEAVADAIKSLRGLPLDIDPSPYQSMTHIASTAREFASRRKLGLLAIDYVGLVDTEDKRTPRHEAVAKVSRRCKALAKELDVPLLLLAQLNRASETRHDKKPRLSDLRETGSLEQDCDTCILLHQPDDHREPLDVVVAKQRKGPTGEFQLRFKRHLMRFEAVAEPGVRDRRPRAGDDTPFD